MTTQRRKWNIKELESLAQTRGGHFLSEIYLGHKKKHLWKCSNNHIWEATAKNVTSVKRSWCVICSNAMKIKNVSNLNIDDLKKAAKKNNGKCLSDNYTNIMTKYTWKCEKNHIWEASFNNIRNNNSWCKKCSDSQPRKWNIEEIKNLAEKFGGSLLSTEYHGHNKKYTWKCLNNHIWNATLKSVAGNGTWCKLCSHLNRKKINSKFDIEDLKKIAKENGGECLSEKYLTIQDKYLWICKNNHVWEAQFSSVKYGSWCKICYYENKSNNGFRKLKEECIKRNQKLITKEYLGYRIPHKIKCEKGHIWKALPNNFINNKTECSVCISVRMKKPKKYNINFIKNIAYQYGGICLSSKYLGYGNKHRMICKNKHTFEKTINEIISQGSWCPHCNPKSNMEEYTRYTLNIILGSSLVRKNPSWLKPEGKRNPYQLDGYDKLKNIAFEYDGLQHSQVVKYYKGTQESLEKQKERDQYKTKKCEENNITLIRIDQSDAKTLKKLVETCLKKASKYQLKIKENNLDKITKKIRIEFGINNYTKIRKLNKSENNVLKKRRSWNIITLRSFAKSQNGKFLSSEYIGHKKKHIWECSRNHIWEGTVNQVTSKHSPWCKICRYENKGKGG